MSSHHLDPFPFSGDFGGISVPTLLRLLVDAEPQQTGRTTGQRAVRGFQPKFDLFETKESYELYGELPGIDQKDISVEFIDPTSLVIKGHVERAYAGPGQAQPQGRITGDVSDQHQSHKATVEDDPQEGGQAQQQQVSKQNQQGQQSQQSRHKFWIMERNVGDFSRIFTFPTRVDQDSVKASFKNGILILSVPKAAAHQSKKITIE